MTYPDQPPIKCSFCTGEAVYRPLDEMEKYHIHIFFCDACSAEYLLFPNGIETSRSLYVTINDKMYRWTINAKSAHLWLVQEPGISGQKKNGKLKIIFSIRESNGDIIPKVTPANIVEKIKTWLLFL